MPDKLTELKARLAEVDDLENAAALLEWDQLTMMPLGGASGRADQSATLQKIAHEKFIADEMGRLLADLDAEFQEAPAENDDTALVRVANRLYRRQTQIPTQLVAEIVQATSIGQSIWAEARAQSNFQAFLPQLEKIFDLKCQVAACFPEAASPYDALLEDYEPGATTAQMRAMFDELKRELPPLVQAIATNSTGHEGDILHGDFDAERQWNLSLRAVEQLGYDFNQGRQDKTVHPFETSLGLHDVRITNRVRRDHLTACLMGSLHECGHALYDLGYPDRYARSPLGHSASLGIHESQSRLWENLVGRSRGYWQFFFPQLQAAFPQQLAGQTAESFYHAVNTVQPTFVRVEADEVTYNLHTLLRFEMEVDLLEGRLEVKHAPEAWNAKVKDYLGLTVTEDRLGVLQDTHWASGLIGYFPTYTIGNLASAQFFNKAVADVPSIPDDIAQGRFAGLLGWLRQNVHQHARKYLPGDLVHVATGEPLSAGPYLAYIKNKYRELYRL
jgi:carboxypeptidase Taq